MKLPYHYLKPNFMAKNLTINILCLFFMALSIKSMAQCDNPDVVPPFVVCKENLELELDPTTGTVTLEATVLNDGSFDNCPGPLSFFIDEAPSANQPSSFTSISFDESDIGQYALVLWAVDEAGNESFCLGTVTIRDACNGNNSAIVACNDEITVLALPGETINVYPGNMLEGGPYCSDYDVKLGVNGNYVPFLTVDESNMGYNQMFVRDIVTGNACWGYLIVETECTNDIQPPTAICNTEIDINLLMGSDSTELFAAQFDEGSFDNCSTNLSYFAEFSPPSSTPPTATSLKLGAGDYYVTLWVIDEAGNANRCWSQVSVHPDCTGGSNPALACKDLVSVAVPPVQAYFPAFFLDGGAGPFCEDYEVRLDDDAFNGIVVLGMDDLGMHTFEVRDPQTGNTCSGFIMAVIDCGITNDPPTAVCQDLLDLQYTTGGLQVNAVDLDGGSTDDCPAPIQLFIEKAPASATPPNTTSIIYQASEFGINTAVLWVVDATGNHSHCLSTIAVDTCNAPPSLACNDLVTIEVQGTQPAYFYPSDILEGDFCPNQMQISTGVPGSQQDYLTFTSANVGFQFVQAINIVTGNSCWGTVQIVNNCAGDIVPPTAVCVENVTVQLSVDGPDLTYLKAADLNEGSFDNCTAPDELIFAIEQGTIPSPTMPNADNLSLTTIGTFSDVYLWVADALGNTNICLVTVEVIPPKCTPDATAPALVAPPDTTISSDAADAMNLDLGDYAQLNGYFGTAYAWDYCGLDTVVQTNSTVTDNCGNLVTLTRFFTAIDDAGNTRSAEQNIHITRDFSINLPSDFKPGDPGVPGEVTVLASNGLQFEITYNDFNTDFNCDSQPDHIVRKWDVVNLCDFDVPENPFVLPFHDGDNDGNIGDPYAIWVVNDSIYLLENGLPLENLGENTGMFKYKQFIQYNNDDTLHLAVVGTVFMDTLVNCNLDSNEPLLGNWKVKATGLTSGQHYFTTTDANGLYELNNICAIDEEVEISLEVPFNYGQTCATTYLVQTIVNMPAVQNIAVQLNEECDLMEVDLATPFLRRCFPNTYTVSYSNYSANTIEAAYVEVQLDDFMSFTNSSVPGTLVSNNLYSFQLGDLEPGQSGSFTVDFDLSCEAELGQTHCTEAHIFPDTLCPVNANWSGANVEVTGACINDEIILSIKNTGTGSMNTPLNFIVVEDVIMFDGGSFNLASGQTYNLEPITATGATYRLEAQQVSGHPYPGNVAVALEGCNGLNTTGLVNLFPLENPNPFISSDCRENEGSFDPNDKSALPLGYGEEHYIYRNTDIEYLIRFQNTGTDTAFNVVVMDTLSPYLNPVSIRPGAASHDFSFEVLDGNILRFTFNNIMLPDSNANQAASHGFVQFRAKQLDDLSNGTVIENKAAIYFDFNEPILTNKVFHTIGEGFIEVSNTVEAGDNRPQPKVYPNPSTSYILFELPVDMGENASFKLHNQLGQLVRNDSFQGSQYRFERKGLAPGIYTYALESNGVKQYSGKVILE